MKILAEIPDHIIPDINRNREYISEVHGISEMQVRYYKSLATMGIAYDADCHDNEIDLNGNRLAMMCGLKKTTIPMKYRRILASVVQSVESNLNRVPEVYTSGNDGKQAACLLLSDWHSGKYSWTPEGQILYGKDICAFRLALLKAKVLDLLSNHHHLDMFDEFVIMLVGDIVDGSGIYPGQILNQDLTAFHDQVSLIVAGVWDLIVSLRSEMDLNIRVKCVPGNHGRQAKDAPANNNFDYMVYQQLHMMAWNEDPKRINVDYSLAMPYLNFPVKGHNFHIRHIAPTQTETPAARAKLLGWKDIHNWDVICYGHLHHPGNSEITPGCVAMMNGSPIGMDDFSEGLAKASRPSQKLFGVHADVGVTFQYDVYLDKFSDGGDAAKLLEKYPILSARR